MPSPQEMVAFRVPRQLLRDLLAAEAEMQLLKTNRSRNDFVHLARALLTSMGGAARDDAERIRNGQS